MARRRGFPARGLRSPGRLTAWALGPNETGVAFTTVTQGLWTTGVALTSGKATIVRIRGYIELMIQASSAVDGGFSGAIGLGLVTTPAFDIGATAVPGPVTELDWDGWMWHHFFSIRTMTATIADGANAYSAVQKIDIDTKAMRRFDEDMTLIGVIETGAESGAATLRAHADTRVLLKLG